jgi:LPXTG-site transpeptidase (sortase) family protein
VSITIPAGVTSSTLADGPCNALDGSTPGSNPLIENLGGKVTFNFGTLSNANVTPGSMTIIYQMIVLDIKANQSGGSLQNSAVWSWNGGSLAASASLVNLVEPDLLIDKNSSATEAPYGAAITFTLEVAHATVSSAHAYDVVVTDILPTGLAFVPGSLSFTGLAPTSNSYDPVTFTLTFVWDEFPLGQTARITFEATFVGPAPVVNSTNVYWSSLPIDPTPAGPVQLSPYNTNATERWYDPLDTAGLNNYGMQDSVRITLPQLPETGFAPGVETILPLQPDWFSYADLGDFWIEIPKLGVKLPIVGVPLNGAGWNLTWLGEQAGWLEGSAYPTHAGNSVITAHVFDSNGQPGPFVDLNKLYWGHQIIVHLGGQKYVYEVREVRTIWPSDRKVFQHEKYSWLTLITCKDYDKTTDSYAQRVAVRAVLVSVEQ